MKMSTKIALTVLTSILLALNVYSYSDQKIGGGGEVSPGLKTNITSLRLWQDLKFGLFIHWGPVSLRGTEIGWSRGREVPIPEYEGLYREFNPVLFDAAEWVAMARAAGMKYLVITTKHHDGFSLWDSAVTDYDIMASPFKRDVLKELSAECERQGILFGTYYSICDWHHPDYTTRYGGDPRPVEQSDMSRYIAFMKNQLRELVTGYRTRLLWFDGYWEPSWTHEMGMDLYAFVRGLDDDILINNRVDRGRREARHEMVSVKYAGDYGTPEQEVGAFNIEEPWESCITICRQWAWKPNDRLKTRRECLHILAQTVGGGGNLLLNVGPMLDGRVEARQVERLSEIGAWLQKYGESIYATKGGPYKTSSWLASTNTDRRVYLHLLLWPNGDLHLPDLPGRKILSVRFLGGQPLEFEQKKEGIRIRLPHAPPDPDDTVVILELDRPAEGIEPLDVPRVALRDLDPQSITLATPPSPRYAEDGARVLSDRVRGSLSHTDGCWLGYEGEDFEAVVDLGVVRPVQRVSLGCLEAQQSWIFFPEKVDVFASTDGKEFKLIGSSVRSLEEKTERAMTREFSIALKDIKTRFIKLKARNIGVCPAWHPGAGKKAWLFVDEVIID